MDDIDIIKILISKKEPYGKKTHLNTSLDIMVIIPLDLYVQIFKNHYHETFLAYFWLIFR